MLNNFKCIFGNEEEVIVCFGDYEQKKHMKFKELTKGKGMRTLFRRAGFFMVDEFRTSCMCSKCEVGICKKRYLGKAQDHTERMTNYSHYRDCLIVRMKNVVVNGIEM